jgi:hypothetical protein
VLLDFEHSCPLLLFAHTQSARRHPSRRHPAFWFGFDPTVKSLFKKGQQTGLMHCTSRGGKTRLPHVGVRSVYIGE